VVVPKKHIPSFVDYAPSDEPVIRDLLAVVRRIAANVTESEGACRVLTNLGDYQDSKHLHFHVSSGQPLR
jgi:histidine triad (HIT) family protein